MGRLISLFWLLFVFCIFSGCRIYGAYDSAEAIALKLQEAADQSVVIHERLQRELDMVRRMAATNPSLEDVMDEFLGVVEKQARVTQAYTDAAANTEFASPNILFRWVGPDDYRALHRQYGALISDQQMVDDRYDSVCKALWQEHIPGVAEEGRYQIAPYYYHRLRRPCSVSHLDTTENGTAS